MREVKKRKVPGADLKAKIGLEPIRGMKTLSLQCALAGVSRATVYAHRRPQLVCAVELMLCQLIDEEYTRRPFYGSRKMVCFLLKQGHVVDRKRVQRIMREMGLAGMGPGPNTSKGHPQHKVYPYLMRGVPILRPNQVWIVLMPGSTLVRTNLPWAMRCVMRWMCSGSPASDNEYHRTPRIVSLHKYVTSNQGNVL